MCGDYLGGHSSLQVKALADIYEGASGQNIIRSMSTSRSLSTSRVIISQKSNIDIDKEGPVFD